MSAFDPREETDLKSVLFEAVQSGDIDRLTQLCEQNAQAILEAFPRWRNVPEPLRGDPSLVKVYGEGLQGVAQHFAEVRQDPSLVQLLAGNPAEKNPMVRWQAEMRSIDGMVAEGRYDDAAPRLEALGREIASLQGAAVARFLPIVLGRLGECHFRAGRLEEATQPTKQALELCRQNGDLEGVVAYLGNMLEICAGLGATDEAQKVAELLIHNHEQMGNTQRAEAVRERAAKL